MLATTDPQFGYTAKLFKGFFILYTDCTIEFTIIKQCKLCSTQYFLQAPVIVDPTLADIAASGSLIPLQLPEADSATMKRLIEHFVTCNDSKHFCS